MFTVFCAGNIFTVFSGRRHVTGPVLRVGKYDTGVKFGKNKFEVLSAANNLTGDERRKTHASLHNYYGWWLKNCFCSQIKHDIYIATVTFLIIYISKYKPFRKQTKFNYFTLLRATRQQ